MAKHTFEGHEGKKSIEVYQGFDAYETLFVVRIFECFNDFSQVAMVFGAIASVFLKRLLDILAKSSIVEVAGLSGKVSIEESLIVAFSNDDQTFWGFVEFQ
jgi:hypothetical protein